MAVPQKIKNGTSEFHSELEAIPLLSVYPKKPKILIQKDICTPVFTADIIYNSQDMET